MTVRVADTERPGRDRLRAIVTTHYWHPHTGGIETVAKAHSDELVRRGWQVQAHTSRSDRSDPRTEHAESFELHRHAAVNPFERRLRVPVPFLLPGAGRRLRDAATTADVVVAHGHVYPMSVTAGRAARAAGLPFVLVQHSPWVDYPFPIDRIEHAADRLVGRRVIEQADLVICVSRHTQRYVQSISPRASTTVVSNGVDTGRFVPLTRESPDAPIRFVCVRRLVPRNGVDLLLEAWRFAQVGGKAQLVIAGDGPERAALERRAADDPSVSFSGRISDATLVDLMQTARATIVPTRSGEGFGLVAAESHACGTPVIATDQGALGEVVRHGIDGLLVRCDDASDMATAIRSMTHDPELRARLAAGARSTDWSWSRVGDELDDLLAGLVSSRRSRR